MANVLDMTTGNPRGLIMKFALPVIAGNLFQQLYNVADSAVVGQLLGTQAFASVGAAGWYYWLVVSILIGVAQGFSILFAQRIGTGPYADTQSALASSALLMFVFSVILSVAGVLSAKGLLALLNTPENVIGGAALYLRYLFGGLLITGAYNLTAAALRAYGDSRTPLVAVIVAAAANILMDLLFVMAFGWGIAGVAIATLLAQGLALGYCFIVFARVHRRLTPDKSWRVEGKTMRELIYLGSPLALRNGILAAGGLALQYVVNGYGYLFMAGLTAARRLTEFAEQIGAGLESAVLVYTGQNAGAGQTARMRSGVRAALLWALLLAALAAAVFLVLGRPLMRLFLTDEENAAQALRFGYEYLRVIGIALILRYGMQIIRAALEGLGDTVTPMLSGVVELAVRLLVIFSLPLWVGREGIYLSEPMGWLFAGLLLVITYLIHIRPKDNL